MAVLPSVGSAETGPADGPPLKGRTVRRWRTVRPREADGPQFNFCKGGPFGGPFIQRRGFWC